MHKISLSQDQLNIQKTVVAYDFTRMYGYLDRVFPSGIERVDINYLNGLIHDDKFIVRGVIEISSKGNSYLIKLSDELPRLIHRHLYSRWVLENGELEKFQQNALRIRDLILEKIKSIRLITGSRVDEEIFALHKKKTCIYLNCCFINIIEGNQHYELISASGLQPVYVIHDLSAIEFPEYAYGEDQGKRHLNRLIAVCKLNGKIIAISEFVTTRIQEVITILGYTNIQIFVNRNGVNEKFIKYGIKRKYQADKKVQFIILSTIEPRKNHLLLINVWRKLINECDKANIPKLIIIGRRGWNSQNVFDALDKNPALREYILEKNNASDDEIICDIQESKAMLFPSFDEGWGLPIVEAMALGTPVICSDIPVHRECTQNKATYIDPIDGIGWYKIIREVSDGVRKLPLDDFRPITWEQSTNQLKELILNFTSHK